MQISHSAVQAVRSSRIYQLNTPAHFHPHSEHIFVFGSRRTAMLRAKVQPKIMEHYQIR
ncbi:uncharacterized protein BDW43DRAFT_288038 [Aspergillus alliaceus]|uniref:uncharacterized protein n=1 Tax=Petromyces alliaceus TaxID=209559 RepID=UPI0012A6A790|nr:uncharacterized protein BDW43DRAFT_288038 [Aspergillus alliaceus]KAB8229638.1 hypothetical protein BDW43DRAFT_288038 [Aspergillus alliaceus]